MAERPKAFTLIEILIVVTILAIIAMVALPRFLAASQDARDSALASDVQMLRRQVELYKAQHAERNPLLDEKGNLDTANLAVRLTGRTDPDGKLNANGQCGPYVLEWPANPFSAAGVATKIQFGARPVPPRDGAAGWYICTSTCLISPNSKLGATDLDPVDPNALP